MSTSPIVLELGTVVNFGPIAEGFSSITEIARSSTNSMAAGFAELAETTSTADDQMIASLAALGASIESLTVAITAMPKRVVPAVEESASAFTILEERMTEAAATAKISASGIGASFGGLGALLGGGLVVGMIGHLLDDTNKEVIALGNLSDKSGIAISALAGLQLITRELGIEFGSVEQGLVRLGRAQTTAVEGGKAQEAAFRRLGITLDELKTSTPEELLNKISEAVQRSGSSADVAASAITLLGRGGAALIPIFKEYGGTLDDVIRKIGAESGVTEEARQVSLKWQKATADLGDELRELGIAVIPLVIDSGKVFVGMLDNISGALLKGTVYLREFAQDTAAIATSGLAGAIGAISLNADQASEGIAKIDAQTKSLVDSLGLFQKSKPAANDPFGIHGLLKDLNLLHDVPTGEGKDLTAKRGEQASAYRDQLEQQLAALSSETAGQKVLYEQQQITAQEWVASVQRNTEAAYEAESVYFAKLKALYADDPTKLAAISAEQAKTGFSTLAHEEDALASSTKELNKETAEYAALSQKAEIKQQEADIKSLTKAILDRATAVKELLDSEKNLTTAQGGESGSAEIEKVKEEAAQGVITKRQEYEQIVSIYEQEKQAALDSIQKQIDAGQLIVAAAKVNMDQMATLYGPGSEQEIAAQASYAHDLAAYNDLLAKKLEATKKFDKEISAAQDDVDKIYKQSYDKIMSTVNSSIVSMITSHESLGQAVQKVFQSMVSMAIQQMLKMMEEWIYTHVVMAAVNAAFGGSDAQSSQTAKQIVENEADIQSEAGVAAANVFAEAIIAIPFPANLAAAPALSNLAYSQVMAYSGFAEGGLVPEDMMAMVHSGEMVLPPALSAGVQNMVAQGGPRGSDGESGQDGQDRSSGDSHFHYHAGPVQALDADGVGQILERNKRDVGKVMHRLFANGHFTPRDFRR